VAIERWTDERLDQLVTLVAANSQQITQLGERLDQVGERLDQVGERLDQVGERLDQVGVQMGNLQAMVADLREGQALLTQSFAQQQEAMVEFRQGTRSALDRIDRTLDYLRRERE